MSTNVISTALFSNKIMCSWYHISSSLNYISLRISLIIISLIVIIVISSCILWLICCVFNLRTMWNLLLWTFLRTLLFYYSFLRWWNFFISLIVIGSIAIFFISLLRWIICLRSKITLLTYWFIERTIIEKVFVLPILITATKTYKAIGCCKDN